MKIENYVIRKKNPVFLIAEAGVNYNNKLSLAFKMIDIAKKSGVNAIKFQIWKTEKMQLEDSKKPSYQKKIKNKSYYELLKSLEPSQKEQKKIFEYCKKKKILFLSTPYDEESVNFLDDLGVCAFKISSSDLSNHILLEHVATKKKPIILSTGLSTISEVDKTIEFLRKKKMKNKTILLQTTSDYPTKYDHVNLQVISTFKKRYSIPVGFSDHTNNEIASLGAVTLGASLLEKHFTISRNLKGPDQSSSLEPNELNEWVKKIRILEKELGTNMKIITASEKKNLSMRKIIAIKPISKNKKISKKDLVAMRIDGKGILPTDQNLKRIVDKKIKKNVKKIRKFSWNLI